MLRTSCFPNHYVSQPPWRWLPVWLAGAFALRAAVALRSNFILHPDELAQYLEPAHWLVFGNGVLYMDFFYSFRSWLIPGLVAGVLWASDSAGLGEPWFYINAVKLLFCLVSLLLPWGCYHYARTIASENTARLALIFACLWPYLVVVAHKPMSEFVATGLFMAALGLAARTGLRQTMPTVATGFLIALAALVRIQYAPVALALWLMVIISLKPRPALAMIGGSVFATVLIGLLEWYSWGGFFTSYINYWKLNLGGYPEEQPWYFYPPRLVYATAGGILLAIWAIIRQPKSYLLIGICLLMLYAPHALATGHKEFRFLFLLLVLSLIPLAGWFCYRSESAGKRTRLSVPIAAATAFTMLVLSNLLPFDNWLFKKRNFGYLYEHSNLFSVYRFLSAQDDVSGVVQDSDEFLGKPLYYQLHHSVPFYDRRISRELINEFGLGLEQLASHVVINNRRLDDNPHFELLQNNGEYKIYRNRDSSHVLPWVSHTLWYISTRDQLLSSKIFNDPRHVPSVEELFASRLR